MIYKEKNNGKNIMNSNKNSAACSKDPKQISLNNYFIFLHSTSISNLN